MATYRSPAAFRTALAKRFEAYNVSLETGLYGATQEARDDWAELTGGSIKTAQLRRMGHPYGRGRTKADAAGGRALAASINGIYAGARRGVRKPKKGPRCKAPLSPINRQSGTLTDSLVITKISTYHYRIESSAAYWSYLDLGTDRMVARPVAREINQRHKARMNGLASRTTI